jgi:sugar phosphate isomerase/epimerase
MSIRSISRQKVLYGLPPPKFSGKISPENDLRKHWPTIFDRGSASYWFFPIFDQTGLSPADSPFLAYPFFPMAMKTMTTISRRSFLQQGTVAALSLTALPALSSPTKIKNLGVQLYSVQKEMTQDALGTLKKIAAIGYKQVEPASYMAGKTYGMPVAEFRKAVNDLGMTIPSSHVGFRKGVHWDAAAKDVTDLFKKTIDDAAVLGQKYLINPSPDFIYENLDDVKKTMDMWNKCGEHCKKAGLKFGFHNHHKEFVTMHGGKPLYALMLEALDPAVVVQQLDTCNMAIANAKAAEWLSKYPKHFELLHVKDKHKTKEESATMGEGALDWPAIFAAAKKTNIKYYTIEQESTDGPPIIDCLKTNFAFMKKY